MSVTRNENSEKDSVGISFLRNFLASDDSFEFFTENDRKSEFTVIQQYRKLAKFIHPDKFTTSEDKKLATEAMKKLGSWKEELLSQLLGESVEDFYDRVTSRELGNGQLLE